MGGHQYYDTLAPRGIMSSSEYNEARGGSVSFTKEELKKIHDEIEKKKEDKNQHFKFLNDIEPKTNVFIKTAIKKYRAYKDLSNSDRWILNYLKNIDVLLVKKHKNRWVCCKERLDNIDFAKLES